MESELQQVILGWLLIWANCPERGLNGAERTEVAAARHAAGEGYPVLSSATKADLADALDAALGSFARLCPDVEETRRLRMAAWLSRIFEGDRIHLLLAPDSVAPKIG